MNNETRVALEESIRHWRDNLRLAKAGKSFHFKGEACALCHLFAKTDDCFGCPVSDHTGNGQCAGTPWGGVCDAVYGNFYDNFITAAVKAELDFLISLRPKRAKVKKESAS